MKIFRFRSKVADKNSMIIPTGLGQKLPKRPYVTYFITLSCFVVFGLQISKKIISLKVLENKELQDKRRVTKSKLFNEYCQSHKSFLGIKLSCDKASQIAYPEKKKKKSTIKRRIKKKITSFKNEFELKLIKKDGVVTSLSEYQNYLEIDAQLSDYREKKLAEYPLLGKNHISLTRILFAQFTHNGLLHIFGNMLLLLAFGRNVEARIGHFNFLCAYIISGSIAMPLYALSMKEGTVLLGASANVTAVISMFYLFFRKNNLKLVYLFLGVIPKKLEVPVKFYLPLFIFIPDIIGLVGHSDVAHMAHIYGAICGAAFAYAFLTKEAFCTPFIYNEEWLNFKKAKKTAPSTKKLKLLSSCYHYNNSNPHVQELYIDSFLQLEQNVIKGKKDSVSIFEDILSQRLNFYHKSKKPELSIEVLDSLPLRNKFDNLFKSFNQSDIIKLGDSCYHSGNPLLAIRVYLTFITLYPKAKNSKKIKASILNIIKNGEVDNINDLYKAIIPYKNNVILKDIVITVYRIYQNQQIERNAS